MIIGRLKGQELTKPEVDYRALPALNYSMLKDWDDNPVSFFEQYKLGKRKKDEPTVSKTVGDLTHFFLFDCGGDESEYEHRYEEKFAVADYEVGGGQVFVLTNLLYNVTDEVSEGGKCTVSLEERFEEAFTRLCQQKEKKDGVEVQKYYKGKSIDYAWEDFQNKGLAYFEQRMANIGKTLVTPSLIERARKLGTTILQDDNVNHLLTGRKVYTHFPVEWLYTNENGSRVECKSEFDLFKIDDAAQKIYPVDLKCTWDNEGFEFNYLKLKYYIQQAFYWMAARYYFTYIKPEYKDYEVVPMQYLAADTSMNNRRPLIYQCSERDLSAGLDGFRLNNKLYKGVHQLLREVLWAEENNIWNISKEAFDNNSTLKLNFNYE